MLARPLGFQVDRQTFSAAARNSCLSETGVFVYEHACFCARSWARRGIGMKSRQDCLRISDVCSSCNLSLARRASHPSAVGASCALRVTVRCTSALCVDHYVERVTSHASSTFGISKGLVPSPPRAPAIAHMHTRLSAPPVRHTCARFSLLSEGSRTRRFAGQR